MSIDFTVLKGSPNGIVESTTHRELGHNEVIVRITHSGVCGTDEHFVTSDMGLGHEGVGIVEQIAPGVTSVKVGDRVGFGYVHYYCGICEPCVSGMDVYCVNRKEFISHDRDEGSFGSHVAWDADALFILPKEMKSEHAGPLMCGGATVWGALSQYNLKATDRVGVIGIGGLGHLAIQFASKMGCEVIAFSGTESKKAEALAFGATEFVATKGLKDLKHIGKLNQLLITTSEQPDYDLYLDAMLPGGTIFPLTVDFDRTPVRMLKLIVSGLSIQGSAGAPRKEIRRMLKFCVQHNIHPTIMTWPLNQKGATEALKTLKDGKMRYRGVLVAE